jgi:ABC-2 type transport system ATP-binding protein
MTVIQRMSVPQVSGGTIIQGLPTQNRQRMHMNSVVLESVSKVFGSRPAFFNWIGKERCDSTPALTNINLSVPASHVQVLLGPNGSGKTTTLKLISTMLLPDKGRVLVHGADTSKDAQAVRRRVGFSVANERSFFPRLSARENLDFFATLEDVPRDQRAQRVQALLDETGLLDAADTLVMKFSSGMYQRLGIARALIKNPSVILLDEPTRSLDPASADHCRELVIRLRDASAAILLATHSFHEALAVGDSVAILHHGEVAAYRNIAGLNAEELREFYFHTTGELDETAHFVAGSAS